jgi:alkylation response protein AidB-like acyl-CoA dehydrogenase
VSAPDLAGFRDELRGWLGANVDPDRRASWTEEDRRRTTAGLFDAGLLHVTWPVAYGGRGLSPEYQTVFNEESAPYAWALVQSSVTVGICAATLLDWGSEEQKQRHLPRMLRGDEAWTQLLSEPGAGSDLAGITTRAIREDDAFVINGQKVWTSSARESDYALALVRTDPEQPKYLGLSMLIVDLHAPGVDIRPLRQMSGESHFNEVFLDDVTVPAENLCGELSERAHEFARRIAQVPTAGALMIKEAVNQTQDNQGFYNSLKAAFSLHELNHAHWGVASKGTALAQTEELGAVPWREAGPVVPAQKSTVKASSPAVAGNGVAR